MLDPIQRLKELKTRTTTSRGLTYDQLAKLTGISKPTIVRWILGTAKPSPANIRILAQTLK